MSLFPRRLTNAKAVFVVFVPLVRSVFLLVVVLSGVRIGSAQSDLGPGYPDLSKDSSGSEYRGCQDHGGIKAGVERQTTSNESGYYVITNVPPGLYTVTIEAQVLSDISHLTTSLTRAGSSCGRGADNRLATQTIEVSASTVQLQTESGAVQKLITREQINSLELNGRNPIWLAALVPVRAEPRSPT